MEIEQTAVIPPEVRGRGAGSPPPPPPDSPVRLWGVYAMIAALFAAVVVLFLMLCAVYAQMRTDAAAAAKRAAVVTAPIAPTIPGLTEADVERIANATLDRLLADRQKAIGLVGPKCDVTPADLDRLRDELACKGHTHAVVAPADDEDEGRFSLINEKFRVVFERLTALEQAPAAAQPVDLSEVHRRLAQLQNDIAAAQSAPSVVLQGRGLRVEKRVDVQDE